MNWWQRLRHRDRLEGELDAELRYLSALDTSCQRRDGCDEFAGIHRLGEMHLEAAPQRFRPIFRPRERRQRGGRNDFESAAFVDLRIRVISSKPSISGMPRSTTSTCGFTSAMRSSAVTRGR